MLSLIGQNWTHFLWALIATIMMVIIGFLTPLLLSEIVDSILGSEPFTMPDFLMNPISALGGRDFLRQNLWIPALALILMNVVNGVFTFIKGRSSAIASENIARKLRNDLYRHLQHLPFAYHVKAQAGELIQRCTSDVDTIRRFLAVQVMEVVNTVLMVVIAMSILLPRSVPITLYSLILVPPLFCFATWFFKMVHKSFEVADEADGVLNAVLQENLSGVRVVRAFGREDAEEENFVQQNGSLNAMQLKVGRIAALMNPLTYVVVNLGIIGILYFGANKIGSGALLSGDVVALVNYMSQILVELVKLANLVVLLTRAIASMGRVSQVLDTPSTMAFPEKPVSADAASDVAVAFDHVSLRYQGAGAESLSDVTFTAKKGQTIGVIGGTGSGKTTLVSLIPRFYDATKGQVTLLGQPITAYSKAELNRHVAVVMQKAQLFKGTIRSNLLWGNENATDEELWHALSIAQSEDFVRQKPGKLDDPVEQGGRNLSGGQRQRLTIARALVGHPDILILDDSASALDYATDAALRKALRTLPAETTLFIVSQRTSSLRHADQIIVLDDGHVVGIGTHDALMQTCEVYREIHESQFRKGSDVQ